ncbi:DUF302 domain-containing protein [Cupriavidus sp. NPDC089707]|uniref:DUF302 domain-containing protein n=1 Tax=Cupriavidus sp. NPDC089707 TaxID=3363963 RepID=UPI003811B757
MKALHWLLPAMLLSLAMPLQAADGLVTVPSPLAPRATMDKLEAVVKERGLTVFARIDHAAGAAKIGKSLRPTELLIFGNAQGGTPLMECAQSIGIDLPLKALVWTGADGRTWVSYNDPVFLAQRHGVPECPAAGKLRQALSGLIGAAVAP